MALLMLVAVLATLGAAVATWRWRRCRRAVTPLGDGPAVAIRGRGFHDGALERVVRSAARESGLVPSVEGDADWDRPGPSTIRLAPPVPGDRAVLVEVGADHVEDVLADVLAALVAQGWSIRRSRGRRVSLRRGGLRASLTLSPM